MRIPSFHLPKSKIPLWLVALSAVLFLPLGAVLLLVCFQNKPKQTAFGAKILVGTGAFFSFCLLILVSFWLFGGLTTAEGTAYPLGSFLFFSSLLLALAALYLFYGIRLLALFSKSENTCSTKPVYSQQSTLCPNCGAPATTGSNPNCAYCGTPLV